MQFLRLFRAARVPTVANPFIGLLGSANTSKTGIDVTEEESLSSTAVWSAVTQLSQSIASLPLHLYKRLNPSGKSKYTSHPLYNILHLEPNPEMTALAFREANAGQVLMTGTSFAEIERDNMNRIRGLWPLLSSRMELLRMDNGELVYRYNLSDGTHKNFAKEMILRISGFSHSGLLGYQPIKKNTEAIGLALALQEYFARFFGNGATPPAALEHPGKLSQEAQDRLRKNWNTLYQGLSNAQRVGILEEGMTLKTFGVSPEDAQAIDARKFQIDEVCRVFNMPPHMLKSLDKATYSNIEEQGLEFVIYTLRPWLVRFEQTYSTQLLNEKERKRYFFEHNVSGLLRGDIEKRYAAYVQAISNGLMNADEVRELENMNPQADGQGEKYYVPLNWIPKEDAGEEMPAREPPEQIVDTDNEESSIKGYWENIAPPEKREKLKIDHKMIHGLIRIGRVHYKSIEATAQRVVSRECNAIRKAAKQYLDTNKNSPILIEKRTPSEFTTWLEGFYSNVNHGKYVKQQFGPIMETFLNAINIEASRVLGVNPTEAPWIEEFTEKFLQRFRRQHLKGGQGQLNALVEKYKNDPAVALREIEGRLDEWMKKYAKKIAEDETVRATNAMSRETWMNNGVKKLKWVAIGKSCDFCKRLDGTIVGIKNNFLDAGNVIYAGPNDTDFDIYDSIKGELVFSQTPRVKSPDEKWSSLKVYGNKAHPPIHKG